MAPKKKNNKKGGDDWEADLGESIAPQTPPADGAAEANGDEEEAGGGGLMNLMRKRKEKRKNKGLTEDFVEGEDPTAANGDDAAQTPDLTQIKAPEEANPDDEFALPDKKAKGGKGKQAQAKAAPAAKQDGADGEELGEGGRVLTKAEKEKLKKEREKQRKKEQVSYKHSRRTFDQALQWLTILFHRLPQRRRAVLHQPPRPNLPNLLPKRRRLPRQRHPLPQRLPRQVARRKRSLPLFWPSKSNRRS